MILSEICAWEYKLVYGITQLNNMLISCVHTQCS